MAAAVDISGARHETVHHIWGHISSHSDSSDARSGASRRHRTKKALNERMNLIEFHDSSAESTLSRGSGECALAEVPTMDLAPPVSGTQAYDFAAASSSSYQSRPPYPQLAVHSAEAEPNDAQLSRFYRSGIREAREDLLALHYTGECKPCLYLSSKTGCLNGDNCRFCHLPHAKKNRPRPCKAKRTQCKQIVGMLHTVFGENSQEFHQAAQRFSTESAYMRSILGKQSAQLAAGDMAHQDRGALGTGAIRPPNPGTPATRSPESPEIGTWLGESAVAMLEGAPGDRPFRHSKGTSTSKGQRRR
jgi:hypothetical protein